VLVFEAGNFAGRPEKKGALEAWEYTGRKSLCKMPDTGCRMRDARCGVWDAGRKKLDI
jgi:hypothetical protein